MIGHLEVGTGYWNAYVTCLMGVACKNLSVKSDFSQMCPSRCGFYYERNLHKKCAVFFFTIFCRDFLLSLINADTLLLRDFYVLPTHTHTPINRFQLETV